jgi:hypothetical protein
MSGQLQAAAALPTEKPPLPIEYVAAWAPEQHMYVESRWRFVESDSSPGCSCFDCFGPRSLHTEDNTLSLLLCSTVWRRVGSANTLSLLLCSTI